MKFLIVGLGSIGRRHYENLISLGFHKIAVVEVRQKLDQPQRLFFKKYHPKVYRDLRRVLREEQPDMVFVCNPTSLHRETAMQALRADAHVFIEKPLSNSLVGVRELLAEAKRRKKVIAVGYHFRYHPHLVRIKKLISEKKLGNIFFARFFTGEYLPGWHPWEDYKKSYAAKKDLGGGVVLTQSHDLDAVLWLLGKPKRVRAIVRSSGQLGIAVDDIAEILYECELCPVVSVHLDYLLRPPMKYYTIVGTRARVEWDNEGHLRLITSDGASKNFPLPRTFNRNQMYIYEIRDFIQSVQRGSAFRGANGASGFEVLKMALSAKDVSHTFSKL